MYKGNTNMNDSIPIFFVMKFNEIITPTSSSTDGDTWENQKIFQTKIMQFYLYLKF